jgi:hypothetical protein
MSRRFLIAVAGGFVLIFALGVAAVLSVNNLSLPDSGTKATVPQAVVEAPAAQPTPSPVKLAPVPPPAPFVPVNANGPVTVERSDINQLALAVKLGSSDSVGKDVWARETAIAVKLQKDMCDCDQRNWLNHFVEAGQEEASGSPRFAETLKLLTTLRKDDSDLAQTPPTH